MMDLIYLFTLLIGLFIIIYIYSHFHITRDNFVATFDEVMNNKCFKIDHLGKHNYLGPWDDEHGICAWDDCDETETCWTYGLDPYVDLINSRLDDSKKHTAYKYTEVKDLRKKRRHDGKCVSNGDASVITSDQDPVYEYCGSRPPDSHLLDNNYTKSTCYYYNHDESTPSNRVWRPTSYIQYLDENKEYKWHNITDSREMKNELTGCQKTEITCGSKPIHDGDQCPDPTQIREYTFIDDKGVECGYIGKCKPCSSEYKSCWVFDSSDRQWDSIEYKKEFRKINENNAICDFWQPLDTGHEVINDIHDMNTTYDSVCVKKEQPLFGIGCDNVNITCTEHDTTPTGSDGQSVNLVEKTYSRRWNDTGSDCEYVDVDTGLKVLPNKTCPEYCNTDGSVKTDGNGIKISDEKQPVMCISHESNCPNYISPLTYFNEQTYSFEIGSSYSLNMSKGCVENTKTPISNKVDHCKSLVSGSDDIKYEYLQDTDTCAKVYTCDKDVQKSCYSKTQPVTTYTLENDGTEFSKCVWKNEYGDKVDERIINSCKSNCNMFNDSATATTYGYDETSKRCKQIVPCDTSLHEIKKCHFINSGLDVYKTTYSQSDIFSACEKNITKNDTLVNYDIPIDCKSNCQAYNRHDHQYYFNINTEQCEEAKVCNALWETESPNTYSETSNRVCNPQSCPQGTYSDTGSKSESNNTCTSKELCSEGKYFNGYGSSTQSDSECLICPTGTYMGSINHSINGCIDKEYKDGHTCENLWSNGTSKTTDDSSCTYCGEGTIYKRDTNLCDACTGCKIYDNDICRDKICTDLLKYDQIGDNGYKWIMNSSCSSCSLSCNKPLMYTLSSDGTYCELQDCPLGTFSDTGKRKSNTGPNYGCTTCNSEYGRLSGNTSCTPQQCNEGYFSINGTNQYRGGNQFTTACTLKTTSRGIGQFLSISTTLTNDNQVLDCPNETYMDQDNLNTHENTSCIHCDTSKGKEIKKNEEGKNIGCDCPENYSLHEDETCHPDCIIDQPFVTKHNLKETTKIVQKNESVTLTCNDYYKNGLGASTFNFTCSDPTNLLTMEPLCKTLDDLPKPQINSLEYTGGPEHQEWEYTFCLKINFDLNFNGDLTNDFPLGNFDFPRFLNDGYYIQIKQSDKRSGFQNIWNNGVNLVFIYNANNKSTSHSTHNGIELYIGNAKSFKHPKANRFVGSTYFNQPDKEKLATYTVRIVKKFTRQDDTIGYIYSNEKSATEWV